MTVIEIAKVSSRGQVAIPKEIRKLMGLQTGDKIVFTKEGAIIKLAKVEPKTFRELTEPLRKLPKKVKEEDVPALIREHRKKWRAESRPGHERPD